MSDHYCCKRCGLRYDECQCLPVVQKVAARLRMKVYREGQCAHNSGAECPYTDWRKGTWAKGFQAAKKYALEQVDEPLPRAPTLEERIDALEARVMELQKALCRGNR